MRLLLILAIPFLLAGCADTDAPPADTLPTDPGPSEPSQPGPGFAPQTGHQESSSDAVSLVGDLYAEGCDEMFCIDAVATNEGGDVYVHDICITSWSESMLQRQSSVQKDEPMAHCEAWGVRAMDSQEQLEVAFTWDGRLWDDDAGEMRDAPEETYTWSIHFAYYTDNEGGGRTELSIDFPVIIGET